MRFLNNDPKNKKPQDNKPQNGDDGRQGRRIIFLMVAALIATLLINSLYTTIANAYLSEITYNEFQTYLDKDEIAELEFQSDRMVILTRDEAKKPSPLPTSEFKQMPRGNRKNSPSLPLSLQPTVLPTHKAVS